MANCVNAGNGPAALVPIMIVGLGLAEFGSKTAFQLLVILLLAFFALASIIGKFQSLLYALLARVTGPDFRSKIPANKAKELLSPFILWVMFPVLVTWLILSSLGHRWEPVAEIPTANDDSESCG